MTAECPGRAGNQSRQAVSGYGPAARSHLIELGVLAEFRNFAGFDVPRRPGIPENAVLGAHRRSVVQCACGYEVVVLGADFVRDARAAAAAEPDRKSFRLWQVEAGDQRFTGQPLHLALRNKNIRDMRAATRPLTTPAMAVSKVRQRRFDFEFHRATQATSG